MVNGSHHGVCALDCGHPFKLPNICTLCSHLYLHPCWKVAPVQHSICKKIGGLAWVQPQPGDTGG